MMIFVFLSGVCLFLVWYEFFYQKTRDWHDYITIAYFVFRIAPWCVVWFSCWYFVSGWLGFFWWSVLFFLLIFPVLLWWTISAYKHERHLVHSVERYLTVLMGGCSLVALLTTGAIFFSLLFEGLKFFSKITPWSFFTGTQWDPPIFLTVSPEEENALYGSLPLFLGTFMISIIAVAFATFMGLMCAIAIREYKMFPRLGKPILENLAAIPTVVYGVFAIILVGPYVHGVGEFLGFSVSSESALVAGLVMGVMLIPFISSLFDDALSSIPETLRDAARASGATESEIILKVVLPAAFPSLMAALLLAFSRAIGETMIVVMAAGLAPNLSLNPFQALTTITVQITSLLIGDQEFNSTPTESAFALGLALFLITFLMNALSIRMLRKRQKVAFL